MRQIDNYEKAVLCAVLEVPEIFIVLVPDLETDDFADRRHRSLWNGLKVLLQERERPDAVRIQEMVEKGKIECSEEYIKELRGYLPSLGWYQTKGAPRWAEKVKERARLRSLRSALTDVLGKTTDTDTSPEHAVSLALGAVLAQKHDELQRFVPLSECRDGFMELLEAWRSGQVADRVATGFKAVDRALGGGLGRGQLIVVGGRPGSMKTAWIWLVLKNVAERLKAQGEGGCVAFASLEMRKEDIIKRAVCAEAKVDSTKLELGQLSAGEFKRVEAAAARFLASDGIPVRIYDGVATSELLHYQMMMMLAYEDVKLLVIDYAELVADDGRDEGARISGVFKAAKNIAKMQDIPVVVLSQLNRQVEHEASKLPGLEHLRWGGEDVADVVLMTYYPYLYIKRGQNVQVPDWLGFEQYEDGEHWSSKTNKDAMNKNKWYLNVAKGRYSDVSIIELHVESEYTLITDKPERQSDNVQLVHRDF